MERDRKLDGSAAVCERRLYSINRPAESAAHTNLCRIHIKSIRPVARLVPFGAPSGDFAGFPFRNVEILQVVPDLLMCHILDAAASLFLQAVFDCRKCDVLLFEQELRDKSDTVPWMACSSLEDSTRPEHSLRVHESFWSIFSCDRDNVLESVCICRTAGDHRLLKDVSVVLRPGERLAIVGPTGSGKTLLLRALALLDPVDTGEIRWHGEVMGGNSAPDFRSQVTYLHQRPALVEGTVEDNLQLPFSLRCHRDRTFSRDAVYELLNQSGRDDSFFQRSARDLSGGEAQIVALLRAIQLNPSVLLLDEATAALDDESTRLIEQLVLNWCGGHDSERAIIWVSHDRQQVARIANRVVTITGGMLTDQPIRSSDPSQ